MTSLAVIVLLTGIFIVKMYLMVGKRLDKLEAISTEQALLDMATFDNVIAYWKNDELDPYTVGLVLHYIRKNIRKLT